MCHIFPCSMEGCAISFLVARMCLVLGLSVPRQNLVTPCPQEILATICLEAKLFSPKKILAGQNISKAKVGSPNARPNFARPKMLAY